jgi:hypothetical protein
MSDVPTTIFFNLLKKYYIPFLILLYVLMLINFLFIYTISFAK